MQLPFNGIAAVLEIPTGNTFFLLLLLVQWKVKMSGAGVKSSGPDPKADASGRDLLLTVLAD